MDYSNFLYFMLWIFWILLILVLFIWVNRMVKIIIWNYILSTIALTISSNIWIFISQIDFKKITFIKNTWWIEEFLLWWNDIVWLVIYFVFLILLITASRIGVWEIKNKMYKMILTIIYAPLTILSMLTSLWIIVLWNITIDPLKLQAFAANFSSNIYIYNFIILTPLWVILPWIITILIFLRIKLPKLNIKMRTKKKKKNKNNNKDDEISIEKIEESNDSNTKEIDI